MVLAWNPQEQRPTLRIYDPGFFFPQWDDEDEDFPSRVHLAWELPADDEAGVKARVGRGMYELGPIAEGGEEDKGAGARQYPWEPGRASSVTCYLTDAEWLLEDLKNGETLDRLPLGKAAYRVRADGTELNRLDLMIDFVPVVHLANTIPDGGERLYQAGRAEGWPAGESLPTRLAWAPHTPTDRAAVLEEVVSAYGAGVLSLETAVAMLVEAGYPIEDASQEVARIRAQAQEEAAMRIAENTARSERGDVGDADQSDAQTAA